MVINYVGADVHSQTTWFCVLNTSGATVLETPVKTNAKDLVGFIRVLSGEVHLAIEEGTQAHWLYSLLRGEVSRMIVCDPSKISRSGGSPNKTDRKDAWRVADLLRKDELHPVFHDYLGKDELRALVRNHQFLTQDLSRVKNQLKALYTSQGISARGQRVYGEKGRESYFEQLSGTGIRTRAQTLYVKLDLFRALVEDARTQLLKEGRKFKPAKILRSVPGIGPIRSSMLVAIMGTPHRFPTRQAFWSYCGFAVVMHATGQYSVAHSGKIIPNKKANKTRGLNRNRNPHLKKVFKGAAIVAVRQPEFAAYLDRLMEGGLSRDVAMVTVARKLATIVLTIWKKEVSYDPKRLLEQEA